MTGNMKPRNWFDALHACQQSGTNYVLVTVLSAAGSAPRDPGSKMVITDAETIDTIGGGHLEHAATQRGRALLLEASQQHTNLQQIEDYKFDSSLGQCCGGAVHLLFECFVSHAQHLTLFGAGHVAKALVPILAQLSLQIHWVDNRSAMFDDAFSANAAAKDTVPTNVHICVTDEPVYELRSIPSHSRILIMTHNHQIDFDLVRQALTAHDFPFVGMIGSETKARRFKQRLAHRDVPEQVIAKLMSPVGDVSIPGKRPIEVAVSIAAQMIQHLHRDLANSQSLQPVEPRNQQWQQSKQLRIQMKNHRES